MTYEETISFLFDQLPMYQRIGKKAYKADLSNTIRLLESLENPYESFKSVHIAGTNGKGTSAHMIAAILQLSGYKTGLYTSPHLKSYRERIKIDGQMIDKEYVVSFIKGIKTLMDDIKPSFFELTVGMAFKYFEYHKVDIAVVETGLGGRLDSTNVITPEVSLITNIGLDHTDILGETLEEIATEKAGIIKNDVPVVVGTLQPAIHHVFENIANERGAKLVVESGSESKISELSYYEKNLRGVKSTINCLREAGWSISDKSEAQGIENYKKITGLKGRFQILRKSPLTIADVAHNIEGLSMLFSEINKLKWKQLHLVFGTVQDKDVHSIISILPREAKFYWTESYVPRSLARNELAKTAQNLGFYGESFKTVNEAMKVAFNQAEQQDLILITGSTFVVSDIEGL